MMEGQMASYAYSGPRRADISGLPLGAWFGWAPKDPPTVLIPRSRTPLKYQPLQFKWSIGFYWYPWWTLPPGSSLRDYFPHIHINGTGPL